MLPLGTLAPSFTLPNTTSGKTVSLDDLKSDKATVIMFICNHCPFVLASLDKVERDGADLAALGVGVAAICSNDADRYPADSFENMARLSVKRGWTFP